eukprot:gene812-2546_t
MSDDEVTSEALAARLCLNPDAKPYSPLKKEDGNTSVPCEDSGAHPLWFDISHLAFNNINPPMSLANGSNYRFFKKDVLPMWEHSENRDGGKWTIWYQRKNGVDKKHMNQHWELLLLLLIGEQFIEADNVT